jgi:two-component system, chemotaxis family, chemotaxis protein CheY
VVGMPLKVLITDDSVFMRNMLKKLITEAGAVIAGEAGDGNEAIQKFDALKPDLCFMDIMMPNLNGIEALKVIMGKDKNAKVIMCTSVGQEKVVNEAVESGASDFIVKPFTKEDVETVIKKYSA